MNNKSYFRIYIFSICIFLFCISAAKAEIPANTPLNISLSLNEAIKSALQNNLNMKLARERINEAQGKKLGGMSDLLPHIELIGSQTHVQRYNLRSQGLPGLLGPFDTFDAEGKISQRIFDLSAFAKARAENLTVNIAQLTEKLAERQVITQTIVAYLNVLQAQEAMKTIESNIKVAKEIVALAQHQYDVGMATLVDGARAQTRLAKETAQRAKIMLSLQTAEFELKRMIGVQLSSTLTLTDNLYFVEELKIDLDQALNEALTNRIETALSEEKVTYKKLKLDEAKKSRWPKISIGGQYGNSGEKYNKYDHEVGQFGINAALPIFEGGETEAKIKQASSQSKQEQMIQNDINQQIEEDVRLSVQILETSIKQVEANDLAQKLSARELEYAKNQAINGLSSNLIIDTAQSTLAQSQDNYIAALAQYQTARLNYYSAIEKLESFNLNGGDNEQRKN
ncbi:MAG: TolC family protein [Candidatus Omnitrophica bacterium]|nr:TolC family protein [Candidatus Omnitrophota bacterium]